MSFKFKFKLCVMHPVMKLYTLLIYRKLIIYIYMKWNDVFNYIYGNLLNWMYSCSTKWIIYLFVTWASLMFDFFIYNYIYFCDNIKFSFFTSLFIITFNQFINFCFIYIHLYYALLNLFLNQLIVFVFKNLSTNYMQSRSNNGLKTSK